MAEVGTYYITVMPDMSKFTGGVNSALKSAGTEGGKQYSASFLDIVKGSALGTALGSLATKAGGAIMGGLSTGISRLDTIQNFPKVMESLGYEGEQAADSIQLIMDRLDGLPTATQDVVTLTQSIADSTGDLDLATKAALGFNDMMLANGASAAEATQAQGVFNRVLGKGNATVAQWQSLQSVMPAQLAAVARELMGEGASVEGLRDALNDGEISWNDFLGAIVKLDTEGSGAVASFRDQAIANSVGIGTALENVQNRIGAGWASILDAIGRENISATINNASYGVRDAMNGIADAISYVKGRIDETNIAQSLSKIGDAIGEAFDGMWSEEDTEVVKRMTDALVELIDNVLAWVADHGDTVKVAALGIAGALLGLVAGQWIVGLPGAIASIQTFFGVLMANPFVLLVGAIMGVVTALYAFFTQTELGKSIVQGAVTFITDLFTGLKTDFDNLVATLKQRMEESSAQWEVFKGNVQGVIDAIIGFFLRLKADFDNTVARIKQNLDDNKVQWENFKTKVSDTVEGIKRAVTEKFDAIKNGITEKIQAAKDKVSDIIEGIKGLFNFEWSLPAPKLPHIEWHWKDIGGLLSIPEFDGIKWYARGGVFDQPAIVGLGERGKEAALPLNRDTYAEMARGIVAEMGGGQPTVLVTGNSFYVRDEGDIERVADAIARRTSRQRGASLA